MHDLAAPLFAACGVCACQAYLCCGCPTELAPWDVLAEMRRFVDP
jgi:hypothetical protein